jgi:hypothetical protein
MRFDGKSTGLFSDEEPKKKRKKRIKITEDQYNRLFNLNEEDEASTTSSSSGGGSKWETGLTRGKANPIDNTVWSSGASSYKNITRGPANPL